MRKVMLILALLVSCDSTQEMAQKELGTGAVCSYTKMDSGYEHCIYRGAAYTCIRSGHQIACAQNIPPAPHYYPEAP